MNVTATGRIDTAKRALVVGLGATGLSVARWLAARGVDVAVTDSRERPPRLQALKDCLPDAALFVGGFSQAALDRADLLVLSPGVAVTAPFVQQARDRGIPVVGDVELFAHAARAPAVAVTGSNGKSTVATLVGLMAERAGRDVRVGGNIGTPALDLLSGPVPDLYVLELSSFQLETTSSLDARAAALLNVSADHMDRYAGVDEYGDAKARVWRGTGAVVANADDARVAALVPEGRDTVWFGLGRPRDDRAYGLDRHDGADWIFQGRRPLIPLSALRMPGRHNAANAMAAMALGAAVGLPEPAMLDALRGFGGLPHRMERVGEYAGVAYFNDSKATNVGATVAALAGLDGPLVLICGGDGKGQDFGPLVGALRGKTRAVVLIGRDGPAIGAALRGVAPTRTAADMHDAVRQAAGTAEPGDTVLLSPACASLDMFDGFEARGRAFVEATRSLA